MQVANKMHADAIYRKQALTEDDRYTCVEPTAQERATHVQTRLRSSFFFDGSPRRAVSLPFDVPPARAPGGDDVAAGVSQRR